MGGIFSRFLNCANDIIKHHIYAEKKKKNKIDQQLNKNFENIYERLLTEITLTFQ